MIYATEILITILVTIWITRTAHKALKSVAPEVVNDEPDTP
jgi:hypothetical protein